MRSTPGGAGSGLNQALASQSAAGAQQAFDALSGEIHASAQTVMLNDSLYVREALLGRMRQASFAGGLGPTAALASGGPTMAYAEASGSSLPPSVASALAYAGGLQPAFPAKTAPLAAPAPETAFWAQGVGAWGSFGGDGNAADVSHTVTGFFSGVDRRLGPNWLAGFAGGYTGSSININHRGSSANIDTAHLAGYVAANYGPWNLRTGAAASFSTLGTSRSIVFPGFVDTAIARYGATTAQIFGEVGYGVTFGQIAAEPFGGLAFVHLGTDSFAETGGIAALSGSGSSDNIGYSTLGGRAATNYVLPNGMVLTPRVSAAWEHAFGSVTPTAALAFQSTGAPFTIAGVPLARDSALVESGLDLHVNQQTRLGLIYSSQLGNHVQHNSVQGKLTWRF
jgi:outer membrane autotransporter protein